MFHCLYLVPIACFVFMFLCDRCGSYNSRCEEGTEWWVGCSALVIDVVDRLVCLFKGVSYDCKRRRATEGGESTVVCM